MNLIFIAGISIAILLFLALVIIILLFRKSKQKEITHQTAINQAVLLISLPKELSGQERETWNIERIREAIGFMESFLNSIAGIKIKRHARDIIGGRQDHISCEIVAISKEVFFYLVCPPEFVDYVKQNLQASFPVAHIDEVEEYNIFQPRGYSSAALFRFSRTFSLPLKTYRQIDSDPLNHLTNALSKLEDHEGAAIQFVIRSANKNWHKLGAAIAHEMQQGKNFKDALKAAQRGIVSKTAEIVGQTVKTPKKTKPGEIPETKQPRQLSPLELEMVKGIEQKASKAGLDTNIRIVVSTHSQARSRALITNIVNAFNQFNLYEYGNKLEALQQKNPESTIQKYIFREFSSKRNILLNTEELSSMYHFPLLSTETPNIHWLKAKKAPAPVNLPSQGIVIGKNVYRGKTTEVRIAPEDRRRHIYSIGMTGTGKSALLQEMARQDIVNGFGVGIVDPHGDLAENLLSIVPASRIKDVVFFNPADTERPIGLNMLEANTVHEQDFAIQEMIMIFYKLVTDPSMIGPMFEHNMRNAMLTLMANPEDPGTITEIPRMFTDPEFQKHKLTSVTDPMVRAFWEKEMAKTSDFHKSEMLGYLISKVGRFVENTMMRNIIGQPHSGFDFKKIMNEGKILIVNLSKGQVGEVNSNLLGLILVSKLQMAAMARADLPEEQRKDFFLYIDEFQNYTTDSIATILSEARKYRLNLTMAHQYLGQLSQQGQDTKIRDAVLGNVGTIVSFRIGVEDAETMAKQFEPVFNEYDLINVDKYNAFVRTLVNNAATRPFNIETIPPQSGNPETTSQIKEYSRLTYGRPRQEVEEEIIRRSKLGTAVNPNADTAHDDPR